MIRSETEYQQAVSRIEDEKLRLDQQREQLTQMGLTAEEIQRAMEPLVSFHYQLIEEVEYYERLKRGDLGEALNLEGIGRMLVAARIARGLTQRQLAQKLEVHESQVSRDERNEYHGITLERAAKVLKALNLELKSQFIGPVLPLKDAS